MQLSHIFPLCYASVTAADVSRTITADAVIAVQQSAPTIMNNTYNTVPATDNSALEQSIVRLNGKLDEQ